MPRGTLHRNRARERRRGRNRPGACGFLGCFAGAWQVWTMVSGCLGARASHPGWIGLGHLALLLAVSACDGSESRATRSEPWLKDEVALSRTESASLRYRAVHGQRLHFSVRAKQGDLRGSVPLHSAELEFDPRALDGGRGKLTFDLEGLALERASEEEVGP